jgi:hypothetical protein
MSSQISQFIQDTKIAINDLLSGRTNEYIYSNFDLAKISGSLKIDIENYFKNKAYYKNASWLVIDYNTSTLTLNGIEQSHILTNNEIPDYLNSLLSHTDKNFNFEIICSILFEKLLGSVTVEHRLQSRDGGIDFYGNFTSKSCLIQDQVMTDFLDVNAWYIGQAKYYKFENKISTAYLRELIGTVELAKHNIWATTKGHNHFDDIKHFDHIVPIFLTNSYFSRDSYRIANQFNIKLFDHADIVFWISILFNCDKDSFEQKFIYEKNRG